MVSVEQVMRETRNYFDVVTKVGTFEILNGQIAGVNLYDGEWTAISGSHYNDGVHRAPLERDETFTGTVWILRPPRSFIDLCERISAYDDKNPTGSYTSESFGGYSYNRGSGDAATGTAAGWQKAFRTQLNMYRRMFTEVDL